MGGRANGLSVALGRRAPTPRAIRERIGFLGRLALQRVLSAAGASLEDVCMARDIRVAIETASQEVWRAGGSLPRVDVLVTPFEDVRLVFHRVAGT